MIGFKLKKRNEKIIEVDFVTNKCDMEARQLNEFPMDLERGSAKIQAMGLSMLLVVTSLGKVPVSLVEADVYGKELSQEERTELLDLIKSDFFAEIEEKNGLVYLKIHF